MRMNSSVGLSGFMATTRGRVAVRVEMTIVAGTRPARYGVAWARRRAGRGSSRISDGYPRGSLPTIAKLLSPGHGKRSFVIHRAIRTDRRRSASRPSEEHHSG